MPSMDPSQIFQSKQVLLTQACLILVYSFFGLNTNAQKILNKLKEVCTCLNISAFYLVNKW